MRYHERTNERKKERNEISPNTRSPVLIILNYAHKHTLIHDRRAGHQVPSLENWGGGLTILQFAEERITGLASFPGLLPPSPLRMLASDNYAWVYLRREKTWYILSRDACRDLRRMTFTSGGSHFI